MRSAARVRALILASAILAGALLIAAPMASAARYALGVGDSALYPAAQSAPLHAAASRVVIDPAKPLSHYDAHIAAHRAVGQLPQLVIGGTGTKNHRSTKNVVTTAVAAAKRWKPVYSVSVVNEPDTAGVSVCGYAKTYLDAYGKLRAAGVKRVLFGEFAPHNAQRWLRATLTRCGTRRRSCARRSATSPGTPTAPASTSPCRCSTMTRQLTHRTPEALRHRGRLRPAPPQRQRPRRERARRRGRWWRHALKVADAHLDRDRRVGHPRAPERGVGLVADRRRRPPAARVRRDRQPLSAFDTGRSTRARGRRPGRLD